MIKQVLSLKLDDTFMTGKVTQRIKGSSENQEYNKLMALIEKIEFVEILHIKFAFHCLFK